MNDDSIHEEISALVEAEHRLRERLTAEGPGDDADGERARLRTLEESLDQCWDLLRQRQARRSAGDDPDQAKPRSVSEVEGYLQ